MADNDAGERPTFESFWKEDKQKGKDTQIAFVNNPIPNQGSSPPPPKDNTNVPGSHDASLDKAQIRRAQVRKAQIQHRQRKAEYINKLEEDVAQYRDLITRAERHSQFLSRENEHFKERLRQASVGQAASRATEWSQQQAQQLQQQHQRLQQQQFQLQQQPLQQEPLQQHPFIAPEQDSGATRTQLEAQNLQEITASNTNAEPKELFGDIDIGALTVTLSMDETLGTPCFNISPASSSPGSYSVPSPSGGSEVDPNQLTPLQEQMAVNFILALEHVCWDHFTEEHLEEVDDMLEGAQGHTLMASAYCMSQAPESVYGELDQFNTQPENPPTLRWPGQGIDLSTLHGLAFSLNNSDTEITPVQAWFELAKRYPATLLVNPHILTSLKREFKPIMRCVYYGAVMERSAFEAAATRVLGSLGSVPNTTGGLGTAPVIL
jgi:hypothetical protein